MFAFCVLNHLRIVVRKALSPRLMQVPVTVPVPFSSRWISIAMHLPAGPRFVLFYVSESLALTSITALEASSGYNIEMSSIYNSIRIPSLWG
jgi:hypothetical protein